MKPFTVTPLTPPGRGGIGSILLSGPGVKEVFSSFFRFSNGRSPSPADLTCLYHIPLFGKFILDTERKFEEEIVVHIVSSEEIEINSHGGETVRNAIVRRLIQAGGTVSSAAPPSWNDSFLNGEYPDFSLTASRLLPYARTERTAQIILDQLNGATERYIEKLSNGRLTNPKTSLERILSALPIGKALYQPPLILLVGPVNAGKSSLLNGILGFNRVLVDSMAGTTRDAVAAETVLDGFPLRICDTAGIRGNAGSIEKEGMEQISSLFGTASLIISVFDITAPGKNPPAEFERLLSNNGLPPLPSQKHRLRLLNKIDLPEQNQYWKTDSFQETLHVSPFLPETMKLLQHKIVQLLFPVIPENGEVVPLNQGEYSFFQKLSSAEK